MERRAPLFSTGIITLDQGSSSVETVEKGQRLMQSAALTSAAIQDVS
jgi:hypothetical protein